MRPCCLLVSPLILGSLLANPLLVSENLPDLASLEASMEASLAASHLATDKPFRPAEVLPYTAGQVGSPDFVQLSL
jgi:hypothetical protein